MDIITFNIPGSNVHTIAIQTDLPTVTQKVTINGYTQPGAKENTAPNPEPINGEIKIEIDATNATIARSALAIEADNSVIKGLSINGASIPDGDMGYSNLELHGNNLTASGNYIGIKADGNSVGVMGRNIVGISVKGKDAIIGGTNPSDRNVLFSKGSTGQTASIVTSESGNKIYGNYIGLAKDGVTDLSPEQADANGLKPPFTVGINAINVGEMTVGGASLSKRNIISGNSAGVIISSQNNVVQGNYIGTDYQGNVSSSITNGMGVTATAGANSIIGGANPGEGNLIAGVKGSGVEVASMKIETLNFTLVPDKIAIVGNSIYNITPFNMFGIGNTNLGIDLSKFFDTDGDFFPDKFEDRGPTANHSTVVADSPNGFINYPVIKSAKQSGNNIDITYDLETTGNQNSTYRVEFFANNKRTIFGYGPGEMLLGSTTTTPGTNKTISLPVSKDYSYMSLSSTNTAIDSTTNSGFGSTSEFSQNVQIANSEDKDADGVPDVIEDAAPNNGDGNNDGIPDSQQSTVTSFKNKDGTYMTLATNGCNENGKVAAIDGSSLNKADDGYHYPFGLTDFTLNCSRGDEVNIELYVYTDESPSLFKPRKFNSTTHQYKDLDNASLTQTKIGGKNAIKLAYSIKDGSANDDDGQENGIIVDPVGLAAKGEDPFAITPGKLVNTGIPTIIITMMAILLISGTLFTYVDYRKHKKPLIESDKALGRHDASKYSYWHHLKVVSIPLARYRLHIIVAKQEVVPTVN